MHGPRARLARALPSIRTVRARPRLWGSQEAKGTGARGPRAAWRRGAPVHPGVRRRAATSATTARGSIEWLHRGGGERVERAERVEWASSAGVEWAASGSSGGELGRRAGVERASSAGVERAINACIALATARAATTIAPSRAASLSPTAIAANAISTSLAATAIASSFTATSEEMGVHGADVSVLFGRRRRRARP